MSPRTGLFVSCKKLRDEGFNTLLGRVGYCTWDNGREHFEFVHTNGLVDDMNTSKIECAKFGRLI